MNIHIYENVTGIFTGVAFDAMSMDVSKAAGFVNKHLTAGHTAYPGLVADSLSQKVDICTGLLIDYEPPQPSLAHEWDSKKKRWELNPAWDVAQRQRADALEGIEALEQRQLRPLRELALGMPGALERLAELNRQIEALR